jgi:hypothetical protein
MNFDPPSRFSLLLRETVFSCQRSLLHERPLFLSLMLSCQRRLASRAVALAHLKHLFLSLMLSCQRRLASRAVALACFKRPVFLLLLLFLGLSGCKCSYLKQAPSQTYFNSANASEGMLLLFEASVEGWVEPCGCTSNPLGGIDRLAALVDEGKKAYGERIAFVDAGNLLFEVEKASDADACVDEERIALLLSQYKKMGVLGTVWGRKDEARGKGYIQLLEQKYGISSLSDHPRFIQNPGARLVLMGVRADSDEKASLAAARESIGQLTKVASERQANATVLIAQMPRSVLKTLEPALAGIDFVILGREPGESPARPERLGANGPWLLRASSLGQYLGSVELHSLGERQKGSTIALDDRAFDASAKHELLETRLLGLTKQLKQETDPNRKTFLRTRLDSTQKDLDAFHEASKTPLPLMEGPHFVYRAIPIDRSIHPQREAQTQLAAYNKRIPELTEDCEKNVECPKLAQGQAHYVGVDTCKTCHQQAYDVWKGAVVESAAKDKNGKPIVRKMGHTRAWLTLEHDHKTGDRACIGCHSTGFMEPGGYCRVKDVDFRRNVQCEVCHGPGSRHVEAGGDPEFIRRQVPESTCRTCHKVPHIPTSESFVYEDKLKLILGPGHGSALLKKISHGS